MNIDALGLKFRHDDVAFNLLRTDDKDKHPESQAKPAGDKGGCNRYKPGNDGTDVGDEVKKEGNQRKQQGIFQPKAEKTNQSDHKQTA